MLIFTQLKLVKTSWFMWLHMLDWKKKKDIPAAKSNVVIHNDKLKATIQNHLFHFIQWKWASKALIMSSKKSVS